MKKVIPIFHPFTGHKKELLREIADTLDSRWWGQGPKVDKFEQAFSKKFGYEYPLFVNSGTSALELAYHLIGLKPGDEVIVPILDCTAGQTGLLRRGVKIVFADINKNDLNLSFEDLKQKITNKTKAVVAVALGGIDIDRRIAPYLRKRKIPLIYDAAQHHEPKRLNADYVCYSFQAIKHITTCDGGMLCLKDKKTHKRAKLLRWFGIDRDLKKKHNYQAWERRQMTFDIEEAGYKYQPTDVDACFGLVGLKYLDQVIKGRKVLALEYAKNLQEIIDRNGLTKEFIYVHGGSSWLFCILTEDRDALAAYLKEFNIETNMVHLRNDIFKVFGGKRLNLPNMNWVESRYLYLPINPEVTLNDVSFVCKKIKEFYGSKNR
mgnify:FL=1